MYRAKSLVKKIAKNLDFRKASDIIIYDVRNITPLASYYLVCSADNRRKINSLKDVAEEEVYKANGGKVKRIEGGRESDWVIVDAYDIIVHIFSFDERARIRFDDIYKNCPTVSFVKEEE